MNCRNCGSSIENDAVFCQICGTRLQTAAAENPDVPKTIVYPIVNAEESAYAPSVKFEESAPESRPAQAETDSAGYFAAARSLSGGASGAVPYSTAPSGVQADTPHTIPTMNAAYTQNTAAVITGGSGYVDNATAASFYAPATDPAAQQAENGVPAYSGYAQRADYRQAPVHGGYYDPQNPYAPAGSGDPEASAAKKKKSGKTPLIIISALLALVLILLALILILKSSSGKNKRQEEDASDFGSVASAEESVTAAPSASPQAVQPATDDEAPAEVSALPSGGSISEQDSGAAASPTPSAAEVSPSPTPTPTAAPVPETTAEPTAISTPTEQPAATETPAAEDGEENPEEDGGGNTHEGDPFVIPTVPADAAASGMCGSNMIWYLSSDGVLNIAGTGEMYDYELEGMGNVWFSTAPWFDEADSISSVVISEGVTSIGAYAFHGSMPGLAKLQASSVTLPSTLTRIGKNAFNNCDTITEFHFLGEVPEMGENAFGNITATAYYPAAKSSWTAGACDGLGGSITCAAE